MTVAPTTVAIVDYGLGNLGSLVNIFKKIGEPAEVVSDPAAVGRAEKLVLPGVGHFGRAMEELERRAEALGAGEILLTAIARDGTRAGYDLDLIRGVSDAVSIPVIASGGASGVDDLVAAVRQGNASAVAAGALFVYYGRRRAVLINPTSRRAFAQAWARVE